MSYQVIARKYRPQTFDEVVGQPLVTDTLKNAILQQRVAHGYIFSGARGVGKTTTARILAKALNCAQGPTITPDGTCDSCREIAAGNSVDVLEIDAASNRGIDEIRELRETVRYLPSRDRYKVFIIDEVHMLTTEAFNALLKTLEEPPPRSLFILATTEVHKLPPTIQSRCQHFSFRLLDYSEIHSQLERIVTAEGVRADESALAPIAQAAEGSLRDALSLLDQVIAACGDTLDEKRVRQLLGVVPTRFMREVVEAVYAGEARRVLDLVGQLTAEGYELGHFSAQLSDTIRNLMVARSCGAESPLLQVPKAERAILADLAKLWSEEDLTRFFQIVLRLQSEMRYSLQPRFHLELGLMKLVHARRLASLESLLGELQGLRGAEKPGGAPPSTPGPKVNAVPAPAALVRTGSAAPDFPSGPSGPAPPGRPPEKVASPSPGPAEVSRPSASVVAPAAAVAAKSALATPATGRAGAASKVAAHEGVPESQDSQLAAVKTLLFNRSQKMVSTCLEQASGWRLENGEVRFLFPRERSSIADLLKSRERMEQLREACSEVLGRAVKIYVTLDDSVERASNVRASAQDRAANDPAVDSFRKRFDCTLLDVKDLSQE
jgi:DNA polymerase III subunit gamma/tau